MDGVVTLPLAMNGGAGDKSYANNSSLQKKVLAMTWPITKEAITDLCNNNTGTFPQALLTMADLGCSSGPNAFMVVFNIIKEVEKIRGELKKNPIEYQIFLNDLPGNDFNAIFKALPNFQQHLPRKEKSDLGPCFFNGVPGSFYRRLFPSKSIHFVHSSYSLHWLSQVPQGLENNKGSIFMSRTSPKSILEAYYKQFQNDFSTFLKCRAEELITEGRMVLTLLGRTSEDRSSKEACYIFELLSLALNDMVKEEKVEGKKVDSFNIPNYMPSPLELEGEILNDGSFTINCLRVSKVDWSCFNTELNPSTTFMDKASSVAKGIRAVVEPILAHHFGAAIIDELFNRYIEIIADQMSKEKTELINLTVSLTRK